MTNRDLPFEDSMGFTVLPKLKTEADFLGPRPDLNVLHARNLQGKLFPTMCGKAKLSSDGETLLTTGGYPPQLRAFELRELSHHALLVLLHTVAPSHIQVSLFNLASL